MPTPPIQKITVTTRDQFMKCPVCLAEFVWVGIFREEPPSLVRMLRARHCPVCGVVIEA